MKVAFRADASITIGSGHVMRCLALAEALRSHGADILFICREFPGHLCDLLELKQFNVVRLPLAPTQPLFPNHSASSRGENLSSDADALQTLAALRGLPWDWLVVDHYGAAANWETSLRGEARNVMVIDDLANRPHDCDLLLDQNYYATPYHRYQGLIPTHCTTLLGPRYALLRQEFVTAKRKLRKRDGKVNRLLVFFGGSDPTDETTKAITALRSFNLYRMVIDVVVGSSNPRHEHIRRLCSDLPECRYHCQVNNMAELCANADLALGAGGSAIWERAYLELPSLVIVTADNQRETTEALSDSGILWNLGWHENVSVDDVANALDRALADPSHLLDLGRRAGMLMTYNGLESGIEAVVHTMITRTSP